MSIRINFNDLFEYDENNSLILKRKTIINGILYEVGDEFKDDNLNFPFNNPENYFYIVNLLKNNDILEGWSII